MEYLVQQKVKFKHCDPAGIVFYPRFFEMMNDAVEAFFEEVLAYPFAEMHKNGGIPTARIETRFVKPCRIGDNLEIALGCSHLGRTSLGLTYRATCAGELRFEASSTVVHVDRDGRPTPWSDSVRNRIAPYIRGTKET